LTLTISGMGISNNSGITQNFVTVAGGEIRFTNNATGGNNVSISNEGGTTNFFDHSTGSASNGAGGTTNFFDRSTGGASNSDGGTTNFFDRSTATGIFNVGGSTSFFNRSTAGNSTILNQNGFVYFANNSTAGSAFIDLDLNSGLQFTNNSTAANSTITAYVASLVVFANNSTAGSAFIGVGDFSNLIFEENSTAASATIFAVGSFISFEGSSRGGTAKIELRQGFFHGSVLYINGHNTIGSLEGDETAVVFLANLTIGSNNLSTTFSGEIAGTGGSLTKIGSGTLVLEGANTYTGDTNVNRGVLQVDGSITSNTFVNRRGTLAGMGTINGNVTNNGTVSPGSAGAPGMLSVTGNYTQAQYATLMIQLAGMSPDQFSALNVMGNANLNGFLDPVLLNGFVPSIGDSFVFLNYASFTGGFSRILHPLFNNGTEQWSVIYQNNNAILTVGPNTIPDQGSTFLLLTLGLLGLVTFRRQLLRGQP
jgi:autotransporter-associated beta strand protein